MLKVFEDDYDKYPTEAGKAYPVVTDSLRFCYAYWHDGWHDVTDDALILDVRFYVNDKKTPYYGKFANLLGGEGRSTSLVVYRNLDTFNCGLVQFGTDNSFSSPISGISSIDDIKYLFESGNVIHHVPSREVSMFNWIVDRSKPVFSATRDITKGIVPHGVDDLIAIAKQNYCQFAYCFFGSEEEKQGFPTPIICNSSMFYSELAELRKEAGYL